MIEREGAWPQLPRPPNVKFYQVVDRAIGKWSVAIEGNDIERKQKAARKMYAALLVRALAYDGADVAVITYKSTKEWIIENCFVPRWLKLAHFGDVNGTNEFGSVRALFVIGRPLPQAEDVSRQAEALFGKYIVKRDYVKDKGHIPIERDAAGNTAVEVQTWRHPDRIAEKLRWQVCEASIIQAVGRARAGRRRPGEPLDIHLWTDVPVPELGTVIPVLWSEVSVGLDGVMLATEGVWLESLTDAELAYRGLVKVTTLKQERWRRGGGLDKSPPPPSSACATTGADKALPPAAPSS